jgi:hypothetical protein
MKNLKRIRWVKMKKLAHKKKCYGITILVSIKNLNSLNGAFSEKRFKERFDGFFTVITKSPESFSEEVIKYGGKCDTNEKIPIGKFKTGDKIHLQVADPFVMEFTVLGYAKSSWGKAQIVLKNNSGDVLMINYYLSVNYAKYIKFV